MQAKTNPGDKLPDLLLPGLAVVFVGTAAGRESAARGAYYAGPGNRFWKTLHKIGLTSRLLMPAEFCQLPGFGIGLTDVAKTGVGNDDEVAAHHYDHPRFIAVVERYRPHAVGFNGKKAASFALKQATKRLSYGLQPQRMNDFTEVFVLPSTSGAASGFWDESHWQALADHVKRGHE